MFEALVENTECLPMPFNSRIGLKPGTYLAEFSPETKRRIEANLPFNGQPVLKILNPIAVSRGDANNTVALSMSGEEHVRFAAFRSFGRSFIKGQTVIVTDERLLSYQTKGTLLGFRKNARGNILAFIDYLEGAAPLRISPDKISLWKPNKIWMVQPVPENNTPSIPSSGDVGSRVSNQVFYTESSANSYALSLANERGVNQVVVESSSYVTPMGEVTQY